MCPGMPLKISVVTPSFNQARFLTETMESIHGQNYPNLQHIVIDGGSTDDSVSIIKRYADKLDYWVSEPDDGQTGALVKGFSHADGEILCWLNSDDLFEKRTLWEVAEYFEKHPASAFIYGDALWIDACGNPIKTKKEIPFNRFIWYYDYNYIPQPSAFWRRNLYHKAGGLDTSFDLAMDADLWARFADIVQPIHVRRLWSRMRLYPDQKNQRLRARSNAEDAQIRQRWAGEEPTWSLAAKGVFAKALRVAWKLSTGCYALR